MRELTTREAEAQRVVTSVVRHMDTVFAAQVRGFDGFDEDDIQDHTSRLWLHLWAGTCDCGLGCCQTRHRLPESQEWQDCHNEAVRVAVRGTYGGASIQVGSFSESMLYRCVLRQGYDRQA